MSGLRSAFDSAEPYGQPAPASRSARPRPVELAFWLYVAAAALSLAGLILGLLQIGGAWELARRQVDAQGQKPPPGVIDGVFITGIVIGTGAAVVLTVSYIVFAILLRRGVGWSRWVLSALAVIAVGGLFAGMLGALQFFCLAAPTVLVFLAPSNEWFRAMKGRRLARR